MLDTYLLIKLHKSKIVVFYPPFSGIASCVRTDGTGLWSLHLTQPYYVALGPVLIWVVCPESNVYIAGPLQYHINYMPQAGYDPQLSGSEFTEWKTVALMNEATTAGIKIGVFGRTKFLLRLFDVIPLIISIYLALILKPESLKMISNPKWFVELITKKIDFGWNFFLPVTDRCQLSPNFGSNGNAEITSLTKLTFSG